MGLRTLREAETEYSRTKRILGLGECTAAFTQHRRSARVLGECIFVREARPGPRERKPLHLQRFPPLLENPFSPALAKSTALQRKLHPSREASHPGENLFVFYLNCLSLFFFAFPLFFLLEIRPGAVPLPVILS